MWILLAFASAFFAGLTSILAKCGIKRTPSETATAIRTGVVLVFAWIMVFIVGSQSTITDISVKSWVFLILSGLATGGSWLCYFRALSLGDVNKVVPIDKSSTVLTMLLAFILFPDTEKLTAVKAVAMVLIAVGTYMMIEKKKQEANGAEGKRSNSYLIWALASALFASLTSILGKMGIDGVESNLGTAIRTAVVLLMAWTVVLVTGKAGTVKDIPRRELGFICLSGLATGASWLCFYRALQDGLASVVVPIDKLSILVSIGFSRVVFKERLSRKAAVGLAIIVVGTLMMVITPNSVKTLFAAIFGGVK
ncbi:MAG: EamA family transporter [Clostridiales bacterium]|nr:EamA family transporter [Clostridiales bacterium]